MNFLPLMQKEVEFFVEAPPSCGVFFAGFFPFEYAVRWIRKTLNK